MDAFYLGRTKVQEDIIQEEIFTNLSYKYNVQNVPVYAAFKAPINTIIQPIGLLLMWKLVPILCVLLAIMKHH
ncbi:Uncharacterised protein [Legionella hackeliae]|uniref:Uncharacterized protein n=1 Tax=Legionella hackeliae TaxID=449 RepID=A0A0A8UXL6_LEGHA|nr:hypothetical protein Lhac_1066 [Legionella hackeliae]CEK11489.1 protein of unknown function [Legionella hackeliae]STX48258.1 Uncharacterised protein [Legionella hackeliae]